MMVTDQSISTQIILASQGAFTQINEQLLIIGYRYCEELLTFLKKQTYCSFHSSCLQIFGMLHFFHPSPDFQSMDYFSLIDYCLFSNRLTYVYYVQKHQLCLLFKKLFSGVSKRKCWSSLSPIPGTLLSRISGPAPSYLVKGDYKIRRS